MSTTKICLIIILKTIYIDLCLQDEEKKKKIMMMIIIITIINIMH